LLRFLKKFFQRKRQIYPTAKVIVNEELKIGENSWIGDFVFIYLNKLIIGKDSCVHAGAHLIGGGELIIGDRVSIGYGVTIGTATDTWRSGRHMSSALPESERDVVRGSIILEDDVFIGANAVISVSKENPHLVLGKGVIIGASAYVDKNISAGKVLIPKREYKIESRPKFGV